MKHLLLSIISVLIIILFMLSTKGSAVEGIILYFVILIYANLTLGKSE